MLLQVDVEKELVSRGRSFKLKAAFSSEEQFVVLFGPSGSGKTLTLESVAGLVTPDAGRISVNGRVLFDSAGPESMFHPATAGLASFSRTTLYFRISAVAENVGFGLKKNWQWRLSKQDRRRVEEFLEIFEISHLKDSFPFDLSGGQKQRVALARALIRKPRTPAPG